MVNNWVFLIEMIPDWSFAASTCSPDSSIGDLLELSIHLLLLVHFGSKEKLKSLKNLNPGKKSSFGFSDFSQKCYCHGGLAVISCNCCVWPTIVCHRQHMNLGALSNSESTLFFLLFWRATDLVRIHRTQWILKVLTIDFYLNDN